MRVVSERIVEVELCVVKRQLRYLFNLHGRMNA